jgi:methionyl-tRNA formyltransferase
MGTPALAVPTLQAVADHHDVVGVVTQPDRHSGRGRKVHASPVKQWAVDARVPVQQPQRLRDQAALDRLAETPFDVAVVVAFGQLLPAAALALPPLGCINLHASLLPRHRGASPIQAAILAGDQETGVTTMLMDEGLDTGPALLQRRIRIAADETAGTLGARLGALGAELMVETLAALAVGALEPEAQDAARATMTRLIRKSDGAIDWTQPADQVDRQVRAMQPWPVAHTQVGGQSLRIWSVEIVETVATVAGGAPGVVVARDGEELVVACGGGDAVRILELQRPGGRRMAAADLMRGHPLPAGTEFGAPGS